MAKRKPKRKPAQQIPVPSRSSKLRTLPDDLLHLQTPAESVWRFLLPVLALAFIVRAAVALSGDFVLHPDEIMQYLEPAHDLVFGNGVIFWEFFYGGRPWLAPGLVAAVLWLFDLLGLGEPLWYIDAVKLVFCALSLSIPAAMYFFARRHFSELAARFALLGGVFWYELVGFAHKPMTEFVSAMLLMALLVLVTSRTVNKPATVVLAALLAAMAVAVRLQYAPLALLLLGIFFFRTDRKLWLLLASLVFFLALGMFDAATWNGGLFHSWLANIRFNLALERAGQTGAWAYLWWLFLASFGLIATCLLATLRDWRRYGFCLALIMLTLLVHSTQEHKEYRFIFVVVPLWLLLGADLLARANLQLRTLVTVVFAAVSLAGILNALPGQKRVYEKFIMETTRTSSDRKVDLIRSEASDFAAYSYHAGPYIASVFGAQDPVFAAYRWLSSAPDVLSVWHPQRLYANLPGYYYLHRKIPLYEGIYASLKNSEELKSSLVSHIVIEGQTTDIPGYEVVRQFGHVHIWRRIDNQAPVPQWQAYRLFIVDGRERFMAGIPDAPPPPGNIGIRFVDEDQ